MIAIRDDGIFVWFRLVQQTRMKIEWRLDEFLSYMKLPSEPQARAAMWNAGKITRMTERESEEARLTDASGITHTPIVLPSSKKKPSPNAIAGAA